MEPYAGEAESLLSRVWDDPREASARGVMSTRQGPRDHMAHSVCTHPDPMKLYWVLEGGGCGVPTPKDTMRSAREVYFGRIGHRALYRCPACVAICAIAHVYNILCYVMSYLFMDLWIHGIYVSMDTSMIWYWYVYNILYHVVVVSRHVSRYGICIQIRGRIPCMVWSV